MTSDIARATAELRSELADRVSTSESVRALHGRDESVFDDHLPDAVVFATSTDDVVATVRTCASHGVPVVPFGAGSSLEGHVLAVRGGVSLDLSGMDGITSLSVDDLDVRVQAGVRREQLNEHLGRHGLFFPVDPGADATLGGMASTNASGTMTVRYGGMRQAVLALQVVLADGRVIETGSRARKSSAGYDLTRLFIGSEGTLGVITELTLRVFGIPECVSAGSCSFDDVGAAVATAIEIVQLGIPVARCELLDVDAIRAVNGHSGLREPELATLFLEFHGAESSVREAAAAAGDVAGRHGGTYRSALDEAARLALWRARHEAFYAARALRPGCRVLPTDACVPVSQLAVCVEETSRDAAALDVPTIIVGHVADGNFHVALMIDPDDRSERALAKHFAERLSERARRLGGTCTGEHGVGLGKRDALADEAGPAVHTMRAIKAALDPMGIMNPGKIFRD